MELQAIDLGTITEKFNAFLIADTQRATATASLEGMGTKPVLPQFVDSDADYNGAITARKTYDTNKANYTSAKNSFGALAKQLGDDLIKVLPQNTWLRVDINTLQQEIQETDYYWIGYNTATEVNNYQPFVKYIHQDAQPVVPLSDNMDNA